MVSRICSRPVRIGLLAAIVVVTGVFAAGCGGRGRGAPKPAIDARAGSSSRKDPVVAGVEGSGSKRPEEEGRERPAAGIVLPGENRLLPSQDPRNLAGSQELAPAAPSDAEAVPPAAAPPVVVQDSGVAPAEGSRPAAPISHGSEKTDPPAAPVSFLPSPIAPGESRFRVQVLASAVPHNAYRVRGELEESLGFPVYVEPEQGILKVRTGDFRDRSDADTLRRRLFGLGYGDAFVVECRGR